MAVGHKSGLNTLKLFSSLSCGRDGRRRGISLCLPHLPLTPRRVDAGAPNFMLPSQLIQLKPGSLKCPEVSMCFLKKRLALSFDGVSCAKCSTLMIKNMSQSSHFWVPLALGCSLLNILVGLKNISIWDNRDSVKRQIKIN